MPSDASNSDRAKEYVDWAVKGIVGALCTGLLATALWSFNTEARVANTEKFEGRIASLEAKEDSYRKLALDIAVVQTKLDSQDRQLERIAKLLESR